MVNSRQRIDQFKQCLLNLHTIEKFLTLIQFSIHFFFLCISKLSTIDCPLYTETLNRMIKQSFATTSFENNRLISDNAQNCGYISNERSPRRMNLADRVALNTFSTVRYAFHNPNL